MIPDVLHIGPIPLHLFGICLAIAFLVAGRVASSELARAGYDPEAAGSALTAAVIGGLLGARLWLVVEDWSAFLRDPVGLLLTGSGFVFYGGLVGGTLGVAWVLRRHRIPFVQGADACAPAVVVGQAIGRIGCQLSGDGDWGRVTDLPWGMRYPHAVVGWPYENPEITVHPTPIYEMLAYFLIFIYLRRQRAQAPPPGTTFGTYLILASSARFLVEFVRINPPVLMGLTAAQLTSLALVLLGALVLRLGRRWQPAAA